MASNDGMVAALSAAGAAFSGGADVPGAAKDARARRLRAILRHLPPDQVRLLRAGLILLDLFALVRFGRRFQRLPPARARRLLALFSRAPLRPLRRLHFALKLLTQFAWFSGEDTWESSGYDGPWVGRIDVPVLPPPRLRRS